MSGTTSTEANVIHVCGDQCFFFFLCPITFCPKLQSTINLIAKGWGENKLTEEELVDLTDPIQSDPRPRSHPRARVFRPELFPRLTNHPTLQTCW